MKIKILIIICLISLGMILSSTVLAVGAISNIRANASDTSISLTWVKSASSDNTVIRYSTAGFPATYADGASAYNGSLSYASISGLSAGTNYYFSAFAYDGASYSSAVNLLVTTLPTISGNATLPYSQPLIPSEAYQDPDTSGWSIHPLDDILEYFADPSYAHGGLGMPTDNLIMFLASMIVVGIGLFTYIKWRTFFASWTIVFILSFFCVTIGVMQGFVIGLLLLIGMGVWAVEKSYQ